MTISVTAFTVILIGVILYCWFLSAQQRGLTRSVEMLERIQGQSDFPRLPDERAA